MDRDNKPYMQILGVIQKEGGKGRETGTLHLRQGTVKSVSPLVVDVAGTNQEAARFYICDRLRKGHTESVQPTGNLSISASCPAGSHNSASVTGGTLTVTTTTSPLQEGDDVLLLTADDWTFYLIDKVVRLT